MATTDPQVHEHEFRISSNWAPLSRDDLIGIAIAGAGVGILLFESVDYHGPFQRAFARLSAVGTPIAVLVSVLIGVL